MSLLRKRQMITGILIAGLTCATPVFAEQATGQVSNPSSQATQTAIEKEVESSLQITSGTIEQNIGTNFEVSVVKDGVVNKDIDDVHKVSITVDGEEYVTSLTEVQFRNGKAYVPVTFEESGVKSLGISIEGIGESTIEVDVLEQAE